jgi:hypothetical protein
MMTEFSASREAVLGAMGSTCREDAMRKLWGDGFDSLLNYLALACAPTDVGMGILRESIERHPVRKTMVLTGERCSGADLEHGTDSPVLLGLVPVMEALAPVSCIRSEKRTGRELNALSLIFSGGVTLTPQMGELPGDVMAAQFNALTNKVYADVVGADSFSMNTGDQGRVLAAILFARRIERVVFCHVVDHIARFGATITVALKQMIDAENGRIEDWACSVSDAMGMGTMTNEAGRAAMDKLRASRRAMPEIIFVALGDWNDRDPLRGRDNDGEGISRAREAFGPMQAPEEAMYRDKHLGCEYAERYAAEQDSIKNIGFACPAMSPEGMTDLIQPWVKERMGYVAE